MNAVAQAHKVATTTSTSEIARELQELLGQRLVAYAAAVRSPKVVGQWAGDANPRPEAEKRLRETYRAVALLKEQYGDQAIRAFLTSAHPDLQERVPLDVIRNGEGIEVVHAAMAFLD